MKLFIDNNYFVGIVNINFKKLKISVQIPYSTIEYIVFNALKAEYEQSLNKNRNSI